MSYARTDGSRFGNPGGCVSYAAEGGTLVPLPDLKLTTSCVTRAGSVTCTFGLMNAGPGVATGNFRLAARLAFTSSKVLSQLPNADVTGCTRGSNSGTGSGGGNVSAFGFCFDLSLAPGATLAGLTATVGAATDPAVPMTASVDEFDAIGESNESNNTFSKTFFAA